MTAYKGRGSCFTQCICECFDNDDYTVTSKICVFNHHEHVQSIEGDDNDILYCQEESIHNCQLIECYNYNICGRKRSQEILDPFREP